MFMASPLNANAGEQCGLLAPAKANGGDPAPGRQRQSREESKAERVAAGELFGEAEARSETEAADAAGHADEPGRQHTSPFFPNKSFNSILSRMASASSRFRRAMKKLC